jgi:hypothetical protein
MFHDMGLTEKYRPSQNRFEIDSANAATDFLQQPRLITPNLTSSKKGVSYGQG